MSEKGYTLDQEIQRMMRRAVGLPHHWERRVIFRCRDCGEQFERWPNNEHDKCEVRTERGVDVR